MANTVPTSTTSGNTQLPYGNVSAEQFRGDCFILPVEGATASGPSLRYLLRREDEVRGIALRGSQRRPANIGQSELYAVLKISGDKR